MTADFVALADRIIPLDLARRITAEYAREHRLVPFEDRGGVLRIAIDDPSHRSAAEIAGKFAGMSVEAVLVPTADLEIALQRLYGRTEDAARAGAESPPPVDAFDDAAAVRVLDALLRRAVRDGASDIHVEPFEKALRVRLRIDGVLHEVGVEAVSARTLAARCKILANLDPAENRRPQDGRFRETVEGRVLDVRVSTIATAFGEKVVLRLLDRTRALLDLSALGMGPTALAAFRQAVARPHGLILVTGPTGSGKTTTLYAALSERNDGRQNITTIEDPVEYDLYGVNQIQVHHKIGVNFAAGLRHVLRQDPDIILVGEIRDAETADVAIQAALTGHLVFSTLHTNDAIGAVARLLDMGTEPFLVADALVAVLSQRLVRRLCPACRSERSVTAEEVARFGVSPDVPVFDAVGCASCLGTGYRGRTGIYENLTLDPRLAGLIRTRASSEAVLHAAISSGHRRLVADGIERALAGITTLDEVGRVA